ncbi:hypothetical protein Tco_0504275, partial [Tanacetum coccineum]
KMPPRRGTRTRTALATATATTPMTDAAIRALILSHPQTGPGRNTCPEA